MSKSRRIHPAILALSFGLLALLCAGFLTSQIEQRLFRHRAERLLAEIQSFELRTTPWDKVQQQLAHWGASEKITGKCDEHECSAEIRLDEAVYHFATANRFLSFLDDYLRWRLKLSYDTGPFARLTVALMHVYVRIGGRPAEAFGTVGMRDGILWAKGFTATVMTSRSHDSGGLDYPLIASVSSQSRFFPFYGDRDPQLVMHLQYEIGKPDGCEICVMGWVHFTPYTDPSDVHRLMQLDLSCLTRFRRCVEQKDIMPTAWAQYTAESPSVESVRDHPICTPVFIETLGRDADEIVSGKILRYKEERFYKNTWRGEAHVRVLETLKGMRGWKGGDMQTIVLFRSDNRPIKAGTAFLFVFNDEHLVALPADNGGPCSPIQLDDENLKLIERGIGWDYSASDRAPVQNP